MTNSLAILGDYAIILLQGTSDKRLEPERLAESGAVRAAALNVHIGLAGFIPVPGAGVASDRQAEAAVSSARRVVTVAVVDAYVAATQRTARLRERVVMAFSDIDRQVAKLGRDALPAEAAGG